MNVHSTAPTDPDAFLRWNEGREGKYELVNGRVVQNMIRVTRQHVRVVQNLLFFLRTRLDARRYEVLTVDFGIKTPDGVRYPDLMVDIAGGSARDLAGTGPVMVCEVLSPSSIATDMVDKLREYTGIPSVQHYLVLSPDEPRGWLWSRETEGWKGPEMFEGAEAVIPLSALSVEVELAQLYPASQAR
jgi:Uma2 family endonuclease